MGGGGGGEREDGKGETKLWCIRQRHSNNILKVTNNKHPALPMVFISVYHVDALDRISNILRGMGRRG